MHKPPKLVTQKTDNSRLQVHPGGLYSEIVLKSKMKQSKNCTVTHKFLHLQKELLRVLNDYSQKVSQYIAVCLVHSPVLA